jgi:formate hydrogenlyase subunit 6/NADH:ubiquinone oxidoreductase subunit I
MKLYKIFTPGINGIAQLLPALILRIKGYRIKGYRPLDLPSNWISLHPGIRKKVVLSIFNRCKRITNKFSDKIFGGRRIYRGLFDLPIDLAITPISFGYYIFGRFMLAKTFIATNACNDCGLCEKKCPVKAIDVINKRRYWSFTCESCMHCMNHCPKRAIETAHSFTFLLWWAAFSLVPYMIIDYIIENNIIPLAQDSFIKQIIFNILIMLCGFAIVFFGYKLLHLLMRFKFFNILIAYTSLTKYKFWRRYKAPKSV